MKKIKDKVMKKQEWDNIKASAEQAWVKEEVNGFFAYIVYKREKEEKERNNKIVGVDVGIKNTLTMSNGEMISLDKRRIMTLVKKAETLQGAIDRKMAINKGRE